MLPQTQTQTARHYIPKTTEQQEEEGDGRSHNGHCNGYVKVCNSAPKREPGGLRGTAVTCHFTSNKWKMFAYVLETKEMPETHNGLNQQSEVVHNKAKTTMLCTKML